MIVVDSSALLAILLPEADARSYADAIVDSEACSISSFTLFETQAVIHKRGLQEGIAQLSRLLTQSRAITVPFDESQAIQAFDTYRRFGKGIHPAGLNLGDCAAYALAKSLDAPLLFKGNDFARTDIRRAL